MKFSIRLNNNHAVADYLKLAQAAEAAGFDQFWVSNDLFLRSGPIILAAVASATHKIEIGTCIVNPYTINPAELAMLAATLDELSGGRFNLGISAGAAEFFKWIGLDQQRPLAAVTESVTVIQRLLSGKPTPLDGRFLHWTPQAYLRFKPQRPVPIYLGAMSPHMLRAIGAWADGGLPLLFPPEHYATVLPYIQEGAQKAGRSLDNIDLAACVWCSISEDRDAAADALKEKIAYYGHALSPLIWQELGVTQDDFRPIEHAIMVENNVEKAKALVTDPMLAIGIVGTPDDLIRRLEKLVGMGVRHLSLGPPLGPDPLAAIEAIGRTVIPYFR
ncbi:MAG: LLM class flavin-dependent oxidoreductase [Anaerolineae bacterium]|nr:LLM class flavin-dependent oxidoreductase [Anaerolineae bacterium]